MDRQDGFGRWVGRGAALSLGVLLVAGVVYLSWQLADLLITLAIAIVFASAIRPVVLLLVARRVPLLAAVLAVYVAIAAIVAPAFVLVAPVIVSEGLALLGRLEEYYVAFRQFVAGTGLPAYIWAPLLPEVPAEAVPVAPVAPEVAQSLVGLVAAALLLVAQVFLIAVMSVFWLGERDHFEAFLVRMVPPSEQRKVTGILREIEAGIGSYVRGQIVLSLAVGLLVLVGLLALRVPFAFSLAFFASILEVLPILGPWIAGAVSVVVAFGQSPILGLAVAGWFVIVHQIEGYILVPKVFQVAVGLSPLLVLLLVLGGALLGGWRGALLAIPIALVVRAILNRVVLPSPATPAAGAPPASGAPASVDQTRLHSP